MQSGANRRAVGESNSPAALSSWNLLNNSPIGSRFKTLAVKARDDERMGRTGGTPQRGMRSPTQRLRVSQQPPSSVTRSNPVAMNLSR